MFSLKLLVSAACGWTTAGRREQHPRTHKSAACRLVWSRSCFVSYMHIVHKPLFAMSSCSFLFYVFWQNGANQMMSLWRCQGCFGEPWVRVLALCRSSSWSESGFYNGLYGTPSVTARLVCVTVSHAFGWRNQRTERSSVLHSWRCVKCSRLLFRCLSSVLTSRTRGAVTAGTLRWRTRVFRSSQCLYACVHNARLSCCWVNGDLVYAGMWCVFVPVDLCVCVRVSVRPCSVSVCVYPLASSDESRSLRFATSADHHPVRVFWRGSSGSGRTRSCMILVSTRNSCFFYFYVMTKYFLSCIINITSITWCPAFSRGLTRLSRSGVSPDEMPLMWGRTFASNKFYYHWGFNILNYNFFFNTHFHFSF